MTRTLHIICAVISAGVALCLAVMTTVMVSLVITRYGFSWSAPWAEEITRYAMVWLVMAGAAILTLFDDHIALHLLSEKLSVRGRKIQSLLSQGMVVAVSAAIFWTSLPFSMSMSDIAAPGSGLSMMIPTFAIPFASALMVLFGLLRIAIELSGNSSLRASLPAQSQYMDSSFRVAEETNESTAQS